MQQNNPSSYIQTMAPSSTNIQAGVSPFLTNFEYNSDGNLSRRRGTTIYDTIKPPKGFTFIQNNASASINIRLEYSSGIDKNYIINITIIVTIYLSKDADGVTYNRIHVTSSNPLFKIKQCDTPISVYNSSILGVQLDSDSDENKIYIYLNNSTNVGKFFNIKQIKFQDVKHVPASGKIPEEYSFTVGPLTDSLFQSKSYINRFYSADRTINIGLNRTFISESNVLHYNGTISTIPGSTKILDKQFLFKADEIIYKIINFDNRIFVITAISIYKGEVQSGIYNFNNISNNIYAYNNSILVVSNYAYIPTTNGLLFRLNLKNSQIEVDTYVNKIGGSISSLISKSLPVTSYYDCYNDTINILYKFNLETVNEIFSKSLIVSNESRQKLSSSPNTTINTILLSKHHKITNTGLESWSSSIFNYDVCGVSQMINNYRNNDVSVQEDALSFTEEINVRKFENTYANKNVSPILTSLYSPKIYRMSSEFRLDDNEPFSMIIGLPVFGYEALLSQNKYNSLSNLQVVISTDNKQSSKIYVDKYVNLSASNIMKAVPASLISDLSTPPIFNDEEVSTKYEKSGISVINCKVQSVLINSCIFCYFASNNIKNFINYKLDF